MIEVSNLSKKYGTYVAVTDVSFTVNDGEILGFLGPNGAGKSTIMNILTGYLSPTSGTAVIDGYDILDNPKEAKKRIGYLPELPPLYVDMTAYEYLSFMYDLKNVKFPKRPHIDEICKLVKIDNVKNRLIKNLSKGYRQRVGVAQALIGNPDVLILDEPTVGLDPKQVIEIRSLIAELGKNHTVIVSSHILSEIQAVCKRIIIINQGHVIADDSPEHLSSVLSSDHSFTARIAGPKNDVMQLVSTIPGVKELTCFGQLEPGTHDYVIEPDGKTDIRRQLFNRLAERNWPLLMFKTNELTLEQIFMQLTESSDRGEEFFAPSSEQLSDNDKAFNDADLKYQETKVASQEKEGDE